MTSDIEISNMLESYTDVIDQTHYDLFVFCQIMTRI